MLEIYTLCNRKVNNYAIFIFATAFLFDAYSFLSKKDLLLNITSYIINDIDNVI